MEEKILSPSLRLKLKVDLGVDPARRLLAGTRATG